jgi:uncharacterized SAM-binding protein YcdF (DUF218 family)
MLALPILLWLGCNQIRSLELPQAILVLGGSTPALEREKFAAELALQHPNLPVWVSGGSTKSYTERVFAKAGIERSRLHLDYRAEDTVTNFTTLVDKFQARGIKSVYLVTSDYHMRRALVIGEIVFGSRGIILKPLSVPTQRSPESIEKAIRDGARALLWVTTGHTGLKLMRGRS